MRFFFIKQKTAYEMRMSDWSSDVCSSDLKRPERLVQPAQHLLLGGERPACESFVAGTHRLQFACLLPIAQADTAPSIRLDPLLQACVVQGAETAQHLRQSSLLRLVGIKPVFIGKNHVVCRRLAGKRAMTDRYICPS